LIRLFTGYHCWLLFDSGVPAGIARLTQHNEAKLRSGSTVRILINGQMKSFQVEIVPDELKSERDRKIYGNNILLSNQLGNTNAPSSFWKGSNATHLAQRAFGPWKMKLGLVATLCSAGLAVAAAYTAAQTNCGKGLQCMSLAARVMAGVSVISAIVAWAKDIF
jgi:hypothetical protein